MHWIDPPRRFGPARPFPVPFIEGFEGPTGAGGGMSAMMMTAARARTLSDCLDVDTPQITDAVDFS